jgi:hypothetical protein
LPFTPTSAWKYYTVDIPIPPLLSETSFNVEVRTGTSVAIDDIAFYPSHAEIHATTYALPFGPSIETRENGMTSYITYDEIGRVKLITDQDGNILKKYDYQIKP